jgi:hypothetical protein
MDNGQYEMDVTKAIINGIDQVMEHPRHEE